ncbi:HPP family protein [Metapseudomonas lalkuanensis]|uniref:HPP family protein n=1 Tax=Metapseudomonas lalkuanensis TaxID=2604832 RepID=A0A5J6QPI9_9GAMM|nr:CBS domain-containing protein [Pseudomonas lalkuanensis]QEY64227.1 HPP family protein [Pseudomonas lalkuanensis]UCO96842.1 HPP family protein [Pseudomonas lalkuanensis]
MPQNPLRLWLQRLLPDASNALPREWLRAAVGGCLAVFLAALACSQLFGTDLALRLVAPFSASTLLLFAMTSSPVAQPWPVVAGNVLAAAIGLLASHWGLPPLATAATAFGLTLVAMQALRCLHPPSCAVALGAALGGPVVSEFGWHLLLPVLLGSLVLVGTAMLFNNLSGVPYPRKIAHPATGPHLTADPLPGERNGIAEVDLDRALAEFGSFVDVTRDDLQRLLHLTEKHALRRSMGDLRAARIMSRDLRTIAPDAPVSEAWKLLDRHHLKALPVLDDKQHLVGILTLSDLLGHAASAAPRSLADRFRARREAPVSRLMTRPVRCVTVDTPVVELVSLLSDRGLHCLPVLDDGGRVVGIVSQSDLIAALYRNWLQDLHQQPALQLAS